ncbi:alpha-1A adrenergic receptor [Aplysia californica]|uniref:Alpha-1A adrenergic receptor n=1 Tax=Aplysia californica TaxID=6500 RepID=A0ABM0ZVD6_APLCA|nr:alpha-1A adrenergic receptor [Aplysia californica]
MSFHPNCSSINVTNLTECLLDTDHAILVTEAPAPNRQLVSDEMRQTLQLAIFSVFCGAVSLFGIGTNVLNIIVFIRQGFKDTMNINLLGLAIADLGCLLTLLGMSIGYNPYLIKTAVWFNLQDLIYFFDGWPHVCMTRVTSLITTFIAVERCLCIAIPLKVKTIITHSRTKGIIVGIFAIMVVVSLPFYYVNILIWTFDPEKNHTVLQLGFRSDRAIVEGIIFSISSVLMPFGSFLVVIICTVILIVKLNSKTKWRQKATSQFAGGSDTSVKEKKVIKMVTLISTIFIACNVPGIVTTVFMVFEPEFSVLGVYANMFFLSWSIAFALGGLNSAVNIFVYYTMSSKYKETMQNLLSCKKK